MSENEIKAALYFYHQISTTHDIIVFGILFFPLFMGLFVIWNIVSESTSIKNRVYEVLKAVKGGQKP